jgi:hypothetical protein
MTPQQRRDHLLDAAGAHITAHGLDFSMDDVARRIDMRHPSAPPDVRSELIDAAMADFEVRR